MNPNEPINPGGGVGLADRPTNPVSGVVPEPSVAAPPPVVAPNMPSDLSDLQKLVNAAKEQVPTDSKSAFVKQFGSAEGATPVSQPTPIVEPSTAEVPSVDQQVASDIAQTVTEVVAQPEEDPQATFVQDIKDAVNKLDEATKEKATP